MTIKLPSHGKNNWVVRAGDNEPTQWAESSFSKTVDSSFPPTDALVSQETEEAQTTSTPKSVKVQIEGVPNR